MRENRPYGLEGGEPVHPASLPLCAPLKAIDLLGESPSQGNVTTLYPTMVTAFARAKVESNLRRNSSP
jgi:hypothetical protein